ncbi:hypothetical protein IGI04_002397 [Brassica rapa subsp. trilocularis]|uniref:Uncharacterized protein n=1 Tax=Brassica rapa subsp. trilocularis TaxID=1813537 RepID=A0ABQ7NVH0_BRACM|nr:hypothetical protein IGI04_002397 [Brassica rapa subsp. trilocularis]
MAVDEHDELPKATQREAELQRQIDDLQGQVTGLHRAWEDINPELSLEFQILKEKLDEHLSNWSRAPRSSASSNRSILPSETRTKPLTQHATRSVDSGLRFAPCRLWKYLTLGHSRISQLQRREEKHLRDKNAKNAQTYDGEDSDSEPKPDKEASDGAARAEPARDSKNQNRGGYQNQPIEKEEGMVVSTWPDISHLSVSRPELINETRKTLISQWTWISLNYHTSSNQNTRITTIKYKKSKREQSRSYSEFAYERLQQGISLGSRAVDEIPSSSNPKTAKPN